jgi:hypothetical protein
MICGTLKKGGNDMLKKLVLGVLVVLGMICFPLVQEVGAYSIPAIDELDDEGATQMAQAELVNALIVRMQEYVDKSVEEISEMWQDYVNESENIGELFSAFLRDKFGLSVSVSYYISYGSYSGGGGCFPSVMSTAWYNIFGAK